MIGDYVLYRGKLCRIEDDWFGDILIISKRMPLQIAKSRDLKPVHLQVVRNK
jgi:hypothetical protein